MKSIRKRFQKGAALFVAVAVVLSGISLPGVEMQEAEAAEVKAANPQATLTVDLDPAAQTGDIIHGAAGFLYGISSENVPTTNTVVPLKSKILVTKGALGTEHPYGDVLDVAKTFLESGGEQIQMYNSNYYGVFGVTANVQQYCNDLKTYICPAVLAWKSAWKEEHGTPENPKDAIGARVDIDGAIVYVPINEGTPVNGAASTNAAWESYYKAIKEMDPEAAIAGPNSAGYGWQFVNTDFRGYVQYCADHNCVPSIITWHELETGQLDGISKHLADFRNIWKTTDWSKYNEANGTSGIPEIPQICFNEYAEMAYCGVPGRLVNWITRIEDEKVTGCLPFWHQANNLNDLAASANEGNGAWWLYKWYGDMSGTTQPAKSNTSYELLSGVSTMDEAKKISTTILGGFSGDITVQLDNLAKTETFKNEKAVHVTVQETMFTGFHGAATETPVVLEGVYPVNADGSVTVKIPDTLFENAYNVTVTQTTGDEISGMVLRGTSGDVYEAENSTLSGGASAATGKTNPDYYMSNDGTSANRAVDMPSGASITYTINAPVDGKYKLDFVYGNGQGTQRNDMNRHDPVNVKQTFSLDGGKEETKIMESTLWQTMTGIKTLYYDLTKGEHTITVKTLDGAGAGMVFHDFLRVSKAGVYKEALPLFNKVYEAELADVNRLLGKTDSTVTTETKLAGYSGGGYVEGLSKRKVTEGGGIRNTVVVEKSGIYNITLRYSSDKAGKANIYVGNTAVTLDRINKTVDLKAGEGWKEVTASIYLEKGINIVDVDMTVAAALDYMRVRELPSQKNSTTIEAEDAVPEAMAQSVKTAESEGASGGKYVVGMEGSYDNPDYLEFTYDAASAGKYQMQVFHSNEDIAGSHTYNIKATDKYAVVEVNGQSDSPKFVMAGNDGRKVYYFVDCGDHNPATLSGEDTFGTNNSVTDQVYGKDAKTGYSWGVEMLDASEVETPGEGSMVSSPDDKAVYTNYQKALSNGEADLLDGKIKEETFRYAHNQGESGINPRYVAYKFEVDPGKYEVTTGMSNTWGNAGSPAVTLSADGVADVTVNYSMAANGRDAKTAVIDLTKAAVNANGKVELHVKAVSSDPTIQMTYISIVEPSEGETQYMNLPPYGTKVLAGSSLPEDIFTGQIVNGMDWFIDYRNMKNETDRYFFINTFSDDTFREKTITLDLKKGKNTIRIYNDNSWNVTYGGTQSTPGTNNLPNFTPNFDKFVITPMALAQAEALEEEYVINVSSTDKGIAYADKNAVKADGEYTLTMEPEEGCELNCLVINGKDVEADKIVKADNGTYTAKITGAKEDQNVEVYFGAPQISREELSKLYEQCKDLKKDSYAAAGWAVFETAREGAKNVLDNKDAKDWEITNAYYTLKDAKDSLKDIRNLIYFVDCGDHEPSTVTYGDDFGKYNSVTDQMYGKDAKTGYFWGVEMRNANEKETPGEGSMVSGAEDKAVYTNYQKALSNTAGDLVDGKAKEETFRYAHNQSEAGINPRYVAYKFEVEPGEYKVTVGMSNTWDNGGTPTVSLNAAGVSSVSESYSIAAAGRQAKTLQIDVSGATANTNGKVELEVLAETTTPTLQMTYIMIEKAGEEPTPPEPPIQKLPYDDVEEGTWYYDAIAYNYYAGTMTGLKPDHFGPADTLVRAQFASVLHKMNGEVEVEYTDKFADVTKDDWFKNPVLWAAEKEIVTGYTGTDLFGANDVVTREQMATMMYRYAKNFKKYEVSADGDCSKFPDAKSIQPFAQEAMKWAVKEEIITGKTINGQLLLDPQGSANRAECATIIQRFLEKYEKKAEK